MCHAWKHGKCCECVAGYAPKLGTGCVKTEELHGQVPDCENSCGPNATCQIVDGSVICGCKAGHDNPFVGCTPTEYRPASFRPSDDDSISVAAIATLSG